MQLQDLPPEILKRIFQFLDFHERIRIERVSKDWRDLCWNWAWLDCQDLRFSHKDLLLSEDWKNNEEIDGKVEELNEAQTKITLQLIKERNCPKFQVYEKQEFTIQSKAMTEYKKLFSDPCLYKTKRPSRSLGKLSALIRRSARNLKCLCIECGINVSTRIGRYFHYLKPNLTHFSMHEPIDLWHLNQIEKYLAPSILSLDLSLNNKKQTIDAFLSLGLKCQKLKCLKINRINDIFERSSKIGQKQFLPLKLQQLYVSDYFHIINCLIEIPKICPDLCFLIFSNRYYNSNEQILNDKDVLRFCTPIFYANSSMYLNLHPSLNSLRALKIEYDNLKQSDLLKLATSCPNLEHLDFIWENYVEDLDGPVDARQLEALYSFKKLSSLSIEISIILRGCVNESMPFHNLSCDDGNLEFSDFLLKFLVTLNSITPLKNLEFRYYSDFCFKKEYVLEIVENLTSLETFLCTIKIHVDIYDELYGDKMKINDFFSSLNKILTKSGNRSCACFRFMNYEYQRSDIIFKWRREYPFELVKVLNLRLNNNFGQSLVLKKISDESFGERNTKILFRIFDFE